MRIKEKIENALNEKGLHPDKLTYRKGIFTYKDSYFYLHGSIPEKLADKITAALPEVTIVDKKVNYPLWPKLAGFVVKFSLREEDSR